MTVTIGYAELAAAAASSAWATDRAALAAVLQDLFPTLLVSAGPAADLVLGPAAAAVGAGRAAAQTAADLADPVTALGAGVDPQTVAAALAGRGVTPTAAARATGTVSFVVPTTTPVPFSFTAALTLAAADGVQYRPTGTAVFGPPGGPTPSGGTLLTSTAAGWVGSVPAAAVDAGPAGNRSAPAGLTVVSGAAPAGAAFFVSAGFAGGRAAETAAEVLARMPAVGDARAPVTAAAARALVAAAVPGVDVRAVGYGHPAMARGRSAAGVSLPGRVDVRLRPAGPLGSAVVRCQAVLVANASGVGRWQVTVPAAAAGQVQVGGVYADGAVPAGAGFALLANGLAYDPAAVPAGADVRSAADAAFGVAGRATAEFLDPTTDLTGLTVGSAAKYYSILLRFAPGVTTAQTALLAAGTPAAGDAVARGPTPVLVAVKAVTQAAAGYTTDADVVREAVAAGVNATGVRRTLTAGAVAAGAAAGMPAGTTLIGVTLSGTVVRPDGVRTALPPTQTLDPGQSGAVGLDPDTVAFYCDPADVTWEPAPAAAPTAAARMGLGLLLTNG